MWVEKMITEIIILEDCNIHKTVNDDFMEYAMQQIRARKKNVKFMFMGDMLEPPKRGD